MGDSQRTSLDVIPQVHISELGSAPELVRCARLAGQWALVICRSLSPQPWDYKSAPPCSVFQNVFGLNSGPHVCNTTTSLTELFPQPLFFMQKCFYVGITCLLKNDRFGALRTGEIPVDLFILVNSLHKEHRSSTKHGNRISFASRKPTESVDQTGAPAFYVSPSTRFHCFQHGVWPWLSYPPLSSKLLRVLINLFKA